MSDAQWDTYKHFSKEEFDCKHTGRNEMRHEFMVVLEHIRSLYDRPMRITSGYRDPSHPVERKKDLRGEHTYGYACDVSCNTSTERYSLIKACLECGVSRIGVNEKFLHIGADPSFPSDVIWTY